MLINFRVRSCWLLVMVWREIILLLLWLIIVTLFSLSRLSERWMLWMWLLIDSGVVVVNWLDLVLGRLIRW